MREGELLALQWKDLDVVGSSLQVRRKVSRITNKGFVVSEPKTAQSQRNIPLAARTLEALKHHRVQQNEQRLALGDVWEDQGLVFANSLSKPLEVSNMIRRSFRPLLVKAGLP